MWLLESGSYVKYWPSEHMQPLLAQLSVHSCPWVHAIFWYLDMDRIKTFWCQKFIVWYELECDYKNLQDDISDQSAADILCEQSIHSIVESHGSDALQVLQ